MSETLADALIPLRRYFESHAVTAKALGHVDRDWLDALILLDKADAILAAHTPPAPADREGPAGGLSEVEEVIAAHTLTTPVQCACGWRETDNEGEATYPAHLAARLAAVRAPDAGLRARVEALAVNDCSGFFQADHPCGHPACMLKADLRAALAAEDAE